MAQRDNSSSASRRIFLGWMMALPIAGRAAAQPTETVPNSKAWADEYDPQSPAYKGKRDLKEARWRDEIDRPPTTQKAWADEYDPTSPAYRGHERVWADEINNPQKLERCWLDEIQNPRSASKERAWRDEIDRPPIAKGESRKLQERCWRDEVGGPQPSSRNERG
jgi:hypothetical protein